MKLWLEAYGSFLLLPGWLPSLLLLLATLVDLPAGVSAWVAMAAAGASHRWLPLAPGRLDLVNPLLVGHLLGATFGLSGPLLLLLLASGPLSLVLGRWLSGRLRRPMCLVFVVVGLGLLACGHSLAMPLASHSAYEGLGYLCALGGIFLVPNPGSGALVLVALALSSHYLLLLSAVAYGLSWLLLAALGVGGDSFTQVLAGTQAILTALMVGGLWLSPGLPSFLLALASALASSLVYLALVPLLLPLHLPPLALPFLLSTWAALAVFAPRPRGFWAFQVLTQPTLPELSWERAGMARARGLDPASLALRAPFRGTWVVYQGGDGPHTHQGPWLHALDFVQQLDDCSFRNQGLALSDFYCYGAEVVAPLAGQVVGLCCDQPDNPPGEVCLDRPWGNYVLIENPQGWVVVLAHLQWGSLRVELGQSLALGQAIARCGNSGRSPQPHLHLHLQRGLELGQPSWPLHLSHVLCQGEFRLDCRPLAGQVLSTPEREVCLGLHLPVGRVLRFRVGSQLHRLRVELDLQGQFWLTSDTGARVAFVETSELLAFYQRCRVPDPILDALVLALGLTPLSFGEGHWQDQTPRRLLRGWSLLPGLVTSRYRRERQGSGWLQQAEHGGQRSWVRLDPHLGPLEIGCQNLVARLEQVGIMPDQGIPGWNLRLAPA